jgi:hypothetical protein
VAPATNHGRLLRVEYGEIVKAADVGRCTWVRSARRLRARDRGLVCGAKSKLASLGFFSSRATRIVVKEEDPGLFKG